VLPEPCDQCRGDGGYFAIVLRNNEPYSKRCDCARGRALAALDALRNQLSHENVEPRISGESAMAGVAMLSQIKFFPAEAAARMLIADELRLICNNDAELLWLCRRMVRLFLEWPGFPILRGVFCSKFTPLDGGQSSVCCETYSDGIPSEFPERESARLALPPGAVVSADPTLDAGVRMVADALDLNKHLAAPRRVVPELLISANEPVRRAITQADMDCAVQEWREKRAREELGGADLASD
jgi:hypothetical protein